jgi:hypothetical protein
MYINNDDNIGNARESNCSICSVAAVLGTTVNGIMNLFPKLKNDYKNRAEFFCFFSKNKTNNDEFTLEDQISGIQSFLNSKEIKEKFRVEYQIEKTITIRFTEGEDYQGKLSKCLNELESNKCFVTHIEEKHELPMFTRGGHFIYGQKDEKNEVRFIDFQTDQGGRPPIVSKEPIFSIYGNKNIELTDNNQYDINLTFIILNKLPTGNIKTRIESLILYQKNPSKLNERLSYGYSNQQRSTNSIRLSVQPKLKKDKCCL